MAITSFNVPNITVAEDAQAITTAVEPADGVSRVLVNTAARLVQVEYNEDRTTPEALKGAIETAGYRVQRYSNGKR